MVSPLKHRTKNLSIYLALTGGGTIAISDILKNGGASEFFRGATIPYRKDELESFVNFEVEKACSLKTAIGMAKQSYYRIFDPQEKPSTMLGLGCTASLAKENQRENRINEAWITTFTDNKAEFWHILFDHKKSRLEQEIELGKIIVNILAVIMRVVGEDYIYQPEGFIAY